MKHIVMMSGGKDSTCMLLKMIENGYQIDDVVFADVGMEFPEMYEHLSRVEENTGIKITRVNIKNTFEYWMLEHVKTKGKNKGKKGYSWPDMRNRWCTALKRQAIKEYLKKYSEGYVEYHGIAMDEPERLLKNAGRNIVYPLAQLGITEREALKYCYEKGYNWGGLYEKYSRVSCYCCPLKRRDDLYTLYKEKRELWDKMIELDKNSERKYTKRYTLREIQKRFEAQKEEGC